MAVLRHPYLTAGSYVGEVTERVGSSSGSGTGSDDIERVSFVTGPCVRAMYGSGPVDDEAAPANSGLGALCGFPDAGGGS